MVDRQGRFVARNLSAAQYVGQIARPELGIAVRGGADVGEFGNATYEGVATGNSYRRSPLTGWTSVVPVPNSALQAPFRESMWWVALGALAAFSIGGAFAVLLADCIGESVRAFSDAAVALIEDRPLPETPTYISELAQVRAAYKHAEHMTVARKKADENVKFPEVFPSGSSL